MRRLTETPRPDWQARVERLGFHFHTIGGEPYWDESVSYHFSAAEIDALEEATQALQGLCLEAIDQVIRAGRLAELDVPPAHQAWVAEAWRQGRPALYGRMDLAYDGSAPPKLLEYNADTPTALFEAAVVQWYWMRETHPEADQFNLLHERLIEAWHAFGIRSGHRGPIHFAAVRASAEDHGTSEYLRDTCIQAGFETAALDMADIGWNGADFTTPDESPIRALCKLYPWEWMVREAFGAHLAYTPLHWVEPPWKMLLSNKGMLPILWELFPGHPNLLPAFTSPAGLGDAWVAKPRLGREGANVTLHTPQGRHATTGPYGAEGCIYQQWTPLFQDAGRHAVIGSWVIGGRACGIGIREDDGPITRDTSRFIPHWFT